jgi:hypothetical protein
MALTMADPSCQTHMLADVVTIVIILEGYKTTLVVTTCTVVKDKKIERIAAYRQTVYYSFRRSASPCSSRGRTTSSSAPMRGRSPRWRRWRRRCSSTSPRSPSATDDRLVFDATPGSKLMTPALEQLARPFRPAAWLFYVRHRMEQQRVVLFFERLCR